MYDLKQEREIGFIYLTVSNRTYTKIEIHSILIEPLK